MKQAYNTIIERKEEYEMDISVCKENEIAALAQTAKEIWNEYFVSLLTQGQIDYMVEQFQSETALKKAILEDGYVYYLLKEDDQIVGYCGVCKKENRLFLSKLYLKKEMRGKGYASALLQQAIAYAKEQGLSAIYLTCNKYNQNSLDVYRHKGFRVIDHAQTDIGCGYIMDDDILQLDL